MKIAIASDHGGYKLKEEVVNYFIENKVEYIDFGTNSLDSVDYPVFAHKVAKAVSEEYDFGVLICTTGVGMCICANKTKNVRAVLATNLDMCKMSREHNNANVLCVGAKYTDINTFIEYFNTFTQTQFAYGRHEKRVNMIENKGGN